MSDFLEDWTPRATLVFNPPGAKVDGNGEILDKEYANKFVLHALQVAQQVAVIVPIPFLCGKWRGKHLYRPHPPAWILPLSARASMPPGGTDIPAKGGTADYGWIGWTRGHQGPTITIWEDLKPPVL